MDLAHIYATLVQFKEAYGASIIAHGITQLTAFTSAQSYNKR